jgi:hypothetical protein
LSPSTPSGRGYTTHAVGKWGLDYPTNYTVPNQPKSRGKPLIERGGLGPRERGFDTFYGLYGSGHNHYTKEVAFTGAVDWHRESSAAMLHYPAVDHEPAEHSPTLCTRETLNLVAGWRHGHPAFLYLAYTALHDPLQAPERFTDAQSQCGRILNWRCVLCVLCVLCSSTHAGRNAGHPCVISPLFSQHAHVAHPLTLLPSPPPFPPVLYPAVRGACSCGPGAASSAGW